MAILQVGERGPEVGNWQRFLSEQGFLDWTHKPLIIDEHYGERTRFATMQWQSQNGLAPNGLIVAGARSIAIAQGFLPFVQAKSYKPAERKVFDLIVLHTMEYPEKPTGAEWCASFFTDPKGRDKQGNLVSLQCSAHYVVDNDSTIQCVRDRDVAHGAPGANHNGLHIEHAGYARQSVAEWSDDYSTMLLERSAALVAKKCAAYAIPAVWLVSPEQLKKGERGICGHDLVSKAFGGSHWDPGPWFPKERYLNLVTNKMTR